MVEEFKVLGLALDEDVRGPICLVIAPGCGQTGRNAHAGKNGHD